MAPAPLESRDALNAAMQTMDPAARNAAVLLAQRVFENPEVVGNKDLLIRECWRACAASLLQFGFDVRANPDAFADFVADHGCDVMHMGISIVNVTLNERERAQTWQTVGKVAAAAVGFALGVWAG